MGEPRPRTTDCAVLKGSKTPFSKKTLKMRYVAAYLLAALGGNESPSTDDLKTILESVGVGYDDERAEIVVNQCKGKSIPELIAAGSENGLYACRWWWWCSSSGRGWW